MIYLNGNWIGKYIPPVLGKLTEVQHGTRARVQDLAKKTMTEHAAEYVDNQPEKAWIDAFVLTKAGYELTSCKCLIPTIICRPEKKTKHRRVNSASTTVLMNDFKVLVGEQNHCILNGLRPQVALQIADKQEEARTRRRQKAEEADHRRQAGGNQQGSSPLPQMDGAHDPTKSPPDSGRSLRTDKDMDDKDDNPYCSGPRPRIVRQYGGSIRYKGKQISW